MKAIKFSVVAVCAMFVCAQGQAQSLKDLLENKSVSSVISSVTSAVGLSSAVDMTGTWTYAGSAVEFESDNLLKKAGGAVAASTVETKIDEQLTKVGIVAGSTSFTFNSDSTFTISGKRTINGTYSYNAEDATVNLKVNALLGTTAMVSGASSQLCLLFEADKLLQLITLVSGKVNNSTLKTISSLASEYEGMNLGLTLKK